MSVDTDFESVSALRLKVRALKHQIEALESGEKYASLREEMRVSIKKKDAEIKRLKHDVSDAEHRIKVMRNNWMQVYADIELEQTRKSAESSRKLKAMEERALRAERHLDAALDAITVKDGDIRRLEAELEDEMGRRMKLQAQINRDYENSSIPSSEKPNRKKIANSRESTGKKPGGQPGHIGHGRRSQVPTTTVHIPAPDKYVNSPNFRFTNRTVTKQVVKISAILCVTEYCTPEFRNKNTGQRVHADFPPGVINDVNYDGSIKALAFLLNSRYCMATDKVREFLSEITGGRLRLSNGMINGLCKELSQKTESLRKEAFSDILLAPVLCTDLTNARVNGEQAYVATCATPNSVLYFAREHKGHEAVTGTPVEDYQGILVHDHDKTYYNYAGLHQECLAHVLRYLKDSMENESDLTWNAQMRELLKEMIHYRNGIALDDAMDSSVVSEFELRYDGAIAIAADEYERKAPSRYYRDGYNLYKRMDVLRESHLLFLHDKKVPADNNLSERLLRVFKRKQRQAMSFRSLDNLSYLCDGLSVIASLRQKEQVLMAGVAAIFDQVSAGP